MFIIFFENNEEDNSNVIEIKGPVNITVGEPIGETEEPLTSSVTVPETPTVARLKEVTNQINLLNEGNPGVAYNPKSPEYRQLVKLQADQEYLKALNIISSNSNPQSYDPAYLGALHTKQQYENTYGIPDKDGNLPQKKKKRFGFF